MSISCHESTPFGVCGSRATVIMFSSPTGNECSIEMTWCYGDAAVLDVEWLQRLTDEDRRYCEKDILPALREKAHDWRWGALLDRAILGPGERQPEQ